MKNLLSSQLNKYTLFLVLALVCFSFGAITTQNQSIVNTQESEQVLNERAVTSYNYYSSAKLNILEGGLSKR